MGLRWRLTGAFLLAVLVAVFGGTAAHLVEVSRRLEDQLQAQIGRMVDSIETEMVQTGQSLDNELSAALDPSARLARAVLSGSDSLRVFSARGKIQPGRVDVLKVLNEHGVIVSSGHWPTSFGALDPNFRTYLEAPGSSARLLDEAIPAGAAPSMQRWAVARWGDVPVVAVAGRFLDERSLEQMRARVGADLLALCRPEAAIGRRVPCVTVKNLQVLPPEPFRSDAAWAQDLVLAKVPLGAGADPPMLFVGLHRGEIDQVEQGFVRRALMVGALSVVLSMLLGIFLAARLVRPVEALSQASAKLAGGDLSTRVQPEGTSVPEVKRLIQSFNQMAADIERSQTQLKRAERVAAWREIARGLAHELKNPLTPILGAMDVLRRARRLGRQDFDEILQEQSDAVVEEVMRLKELADAFSRFARLPDPNPEPLLLAELLDHAIALYVPDDGAVEVERRYADQTSKWLADRTQIMSALTNLIKNAVEAMDGKGRLYVEVSEIGLEDGRGAVEVRIEDSGPGIADEVRDQLFMPYVTTKGSRGTGLGLAMVHRIVAEHGGDIEVGTGRLGGALFRLRFPRQEA